MCRLCASSSKSCASISLLMIVILLLGLDSSSSSQTVSEEIVGGRPAPRYPFFVDTVPCGGSLIASDVVLSAAHCSWDFMGRDEDEERRVLINPVRPPDNASEWTTVAQEYEHPDFDRNTGDNDLLLLKLETPVTTPFARTVPLASSTYTFSPNQPITVMGFGNTEFRGEGSDILLEATVLYAADQTACGMFSAPTSMCVGGLNGASACQGDSGGPYIDSNGVQVGIVSRGNQCTFPEQPIRVSAVVDWIHQTTCEITSDVSSVPWACSPTTMPTAAPTIQPTAAPTVKPTTSLPTIRPTVSPQPTPPPVPMRRPRPPRSKTDLKIGTLVGGRQRGVGRRQRRRRREQQVQSRRGLRR